MELMQRRRGMMLSKGYVVNWNQIVKNGDLVDETGWIVSGSSYIADRWIHLNGFEAVGRYDLTNTLNHNYMLIAAVWSITGIKALTVVTSPRVAEYADQLKMEYFRNTLDMVKVVFKSALAYKYLSFCAGSRTSEVAITNICLFDLTQMFGVGNEPTTTAQFEQWLSENGINPNEYIPYNAGEIRRMTKPSWIL